MTERERFIFALEGKKLAGRIPHFELAFFPTMESIGKVHPLQRDYAQWHQMDEVERQLHREDMADIYITIAEKYEHSAIFIHPNPDTREETLHMLEIIRNRTDNRFFLIKNGDVTYDIPSGGTIDSFVYRLVDEPDAVKQEAERRVEWALKEAEFYARQGYLDGFALCSDYCFNTGPFLNPAQFSEFIAPYLEKLIKGYKEMGFYTIKHTDGNIMPILDQLLQANPHAIHSLDPQGGVDIAEIKKITKGQVCLIGNVNCGLMQTGTDEEVCRSVRYALQSGMPGGRYIFSTSNCVYTGMPLERYELMLDIWRKEGINVE
jgi:uroporphyrinogen decarboxylase